jgi:hypothetical protein
MVVSYFSPQNCILGAILYSAENWYAYFYSFAFALGVVGHLQFLRETFAYVIEVLAEFLFVAFAQWVESREQSPKVLKSPERSRKVQKSREKSRKVEKSLVI